MFCAPTITLPIMASYAPLWRLGSSFLFRSEVGLNGKWQRYQILNGRKMISRVEVCVPHLAERPFGWNGPLLVCALDPAPNKASRTTGPRGSRDEVDPPYSCNRTLCPGHILRAKYVSRTQFFKDASQCPKYAVKEGLPMLILHMLMLMPSW